VVVGYYWRFQLGIELSSDQKDLLASLPGAKVTSTSIAMPQNGAWIMYEVLNAAGIPFISRAPPSFTPRTAKLALPWLQEWIPGFLTPYQRDGVKSVLALPGECGHFWWSAGSGKTLGALVWALADGPRLTVVVTKAAIRPTWTREIRTYARDVAWEVLEGRAPGQLPTIDPSRPTILVTGYDTLPNWIGILKDLKPRSVIFDEIHKVKSHKRWGAEVELDRAEGVVSPLVVDRRGNADGSDMATPSTVPSSPIPVKVTFSLNDNQTAACYLLSRAASRRLGTTATPIKDRIRDLWAQLDLIHPWEWGPYWDWARRYAGAVEGTFGGMKDLGFTNGAELKQRLSYVGHKVPYSVANRDLPLKRRLVTYLKVYEQCKPEGGIAAELRAAGRQGPNALLEARLMEAASRKRKTVLAHARDALEAGLKVVIFTGRRIDCERLRKDADAWLSGGAKNPDGTFVGQIRDLQIFSGHGGDSPDAREKIRLAYMAAKGPALLIGTGDAWGEGLDLQDTDLAIFAMLPYTPGQIIQWEGRFARLGQKRAVLIRYLICEGTIDEHVATILLGKLPAVEKAMDSDEITGLGRELIGASEEELLASLCSKVLGAVSA
jgi:hypothetical protein